MKKSTMSIVVSIHTNVTVNYVDSRTGGDAYRVVSQWVGSVWGSELLIHDVSFDLLDSAGYIVFTGAVRDLHARDVNDRTFPADEGVSEFVYTPSQRTWVY